VLGARLVRKALKLLAETFPWETTGVVSPSDPLGPHSNQVFTACPSLVTNPLSSALSFPMALAITGPESLRRWENSFLASTIPWLE